MRARSTGAPAGRTDRAARLHPTCTLGCERGRAGSTPRPCRGRSSPRAPCPTGARIGTVPSASSPLRAKWTVRGAAFRCCWVESCSVGLNPVTPPGKPHAILRPDESKRSRHVDALLSSLARGAGQNVRSQAMRPVFGSASRPALQSTLDGFPQKHAEPLVVTGRGTVL